MVSYGSPEAVLTPALLLETFGQRVVLSAHPTHGVPLVALVPNGNARRLTPVGASTPRRRGVSEVEGGVGSLRGGESDRARRSPPYVGGALARRCLRCLFGPTRH